MAQFDLLDKAAKLHAAVVTCKVAADANISVWDTVTFDTPAFMPVLLKEGRQYPATDINVYIGTNKIIIDQAIATVANMATLTQRRL
jgi:hypothetical protein